MPRTSSTNLGPGTLEIGDTGTEIDVSCYVNNAMITSDKDAEDDRTMLCGDVLPGAVTYTYSLTGNMDSDHENGAASFFALSQAEPGSQANFTFTPNTAEGTVATGTLTIDPLDFGADEMGAPLASDFEFSIVGKPTYTYGGVAADSEAATTDEEYAA
jgi:hypothetical protein